MTTNSQNLPFAQEFITNAEGHVTKVILSFDEYKRLLEHLEDEGLYRAMMEVENEKSFTMEAALIELDRE